MELLGESAFGRQDSEEEVVEDYNNQKESVSGLECFSGNELVPPAPPILTS
jgi:hypothetical protein